MSKRRRTSSIASRGQEDDSLDSIEASTSTGPTMRKRSKKLDPVKILLLISIFFYFENILDGALSTIV